MTQEQKKFNKKALFGVIALIALVAIFAVVYSVFREKPVEGSKSITIEVVSKDAKSTTYELKTDAMYLRGAMEEAEGLTFGGSESEYGLMVDTVNEVKADYAADGAYWSFYVNGSYCNYGIDTQPVEDGDAFKIVYEVYTPVPEGSKSVSIEVIDDTQTATVYEIKTDAQSLADIFISAEGLTVTLSDSENGKVVDTINGVKADYATDGAYWNVTVNGAFCSNGIENQAIADGDKVQITYEIYVPAEGAKAITIEVVSKTETTVYELKTDADYLRQAMEEAAEEGLTFSGSESEYGMYVETVNGETADFAADGAYWSFYVNDGYCNYGIDTQPVNNGDAFKIVYEIYMAQ